MAKCTEQRTTAMDDLGSDGTGRGRELSGGGMRTSGRVRTFGIEEELILVDPGTGDTVPMATALLDLYVRPMEPSRAPVLTAEFQQEMIEVVTPPHSTLEALQSDITAGRAIADRAARDVGCGLLPWGHRPCPGTTPRPASALLGHGGGIWAHRAGAAYLRLPHPCVCGLAGGGRGRAGPDPDLAAGAGGAERKLALLTRRGHRVRQLPLAGLEPLAVRRSPGDPRLTRGVPPVGA